MNFMDDYDDFSLLYAITQDEGEEWDEEGYLAATRDTPLLDEQTLEEQA
ncbi:hypothetical protein EDC56_2335 [Sinobacterium caligoides]|uniref:Uncharacterized protein n=1 Tax=Sinobacterium caligoides TaxID=933926 RepID=A0A3N2DPZ3_9GAMM|nr:hypothetical protein [Sinobacterium caligoides]ROS01886.1 hypothetical protein EDC56_2335 [Sinobacterium caligoides]